ncbi:PREDICTED: tetratricopeptide repeat protein 14-like [Priapulus caudatus]|uniref:Tetratricopeptide repeat protein 14-like n=1 Tax=Priapulus caudatus TaxID=37621 RepID=A0ABM1E6F4_PRICU|nr:PREDICTED: tetratricopeptide repeat protein 14-like [Priapulus caudatus]
MERLAHRSRGVRANHLAKAVSYHGNDLLQYVQVEQSTHFLATLRETGVRMQCDRPEKPPPTSVKGRDLRCRVLKFIAQKSDVLFTQQQVAPSSQPSRDNEEEDFHAVMPPLESYMGISDMDQKQHFFQSVQLGDVLVCSVAARQESGLQLSVLCTDGATSKRSIWDVGVKVFCPMSEVMLSSSHEDPFDTYEMKAFVRVVVVKVTLHSEMLVVSMKRESLQRAGRHNVKLVRDTGG